MSTANALPFPSPAAPGLPTAAKVFATYAILVGLWAIGSMLYAVTTPSQDGFTIQLEALMFPAGIGILNGKENWRMLARFLCGVTFFMAILGLVVLVFRPENFDYNGPPGWEALMITLAISYIAMDIWGFFVLDRPDVRAACNPAYVPARN